MKKITLITILIFNIFVFSLGFSAESQEWHLTILYQNDTHGHLLPFKNNRADTALGGIAKVATLVKKIKEENILLQNKGNSNTERSFWNSCLFGNWFRKKEDIKQPHYTIFLHSGDIIQGPPLSNVFKGEIDIKAFNLIPLDAVTIGNHEFDFGIDNLNKLMHLAEFSYISANIRKTSDTLDFHINPYIIKDLGEHKVAIIGLTTEETPITTHPKNVKGLEFLPFTDILPPLISKLENETDLIIALTHIGYKNDIELSQNVSGIDIIIGGHSHTIVDTPAVVNGTVICQSGYYGIFLGRIDLTIKDGKIIDYKNKLIRIDNSIEDDTTVANLVNAYNQELGSKLKEVIGVSKVYLDGERTRVRGYETNLGNLLADVMRERGNADIALVNGGSIRASIDSGEVTIEEVINVYPFENNLVVTEITGSDLLKVLKQSTRLAPGEGGFLQVSGIQMVIDNKQPVDIKINGSPLDTLKTYKLALSDFVADGGDGYSIFKKMKFYNTGLVITESIIDYIREKKEISLQVEGRIIRKNGE